jgi:hypothetical protein
MNKVNWTAIIVIAIIVLLVLTFGVGLLGMRGYGGWGYGGWGMMGPWMMGGMFFMWLIPLGVLVLVVLGIAWLVQAFGGRNNPPLQARTCPSCGRGVQADWNSCPYCGTALAK